MLNCTVGGQQGVDRRHQLRKKFTIIEQKKSFAEKEGKGLKKGGKKEKRKRKKEKKKTVSIELLRDAKRVRK